MKNTSTTESRFFRPLNDPDEAPTTADLIGRPLTVPAFKPESGAVVEADGEALSKFGREFRRVVAHLHGISEAEVPLGLVRLAEAANADTEGNLKGLSQPLLKKTPSGRLFYVRLVINAGIPLSWLPNGRTLRLLPGSLHGEANVVTAAGDHETLNLPVMEVDSPDQVLDLREAQRDLLGTDTYTGENRDFIDSIVTNGVTENMDIAPTQLRADDGSSAWTAQVIEGSRRYFANSFIQNILSGKNVRSFATDHWFTEDARRLKDFTAKDLQDLHDGLRMSTTKAARYFPGKSNQASWLEDVADHDVSAIAFQLTRTVEVNWVLKVEPKERTEREDPNPVAATIADFIKHIHVPGNAKKQWAPHDVDGLIAIESIDKLRMFDVVTSEQRSIALGEKRLHWSVGKTVGPWSDLLRATASLIGLLTTEQRLPEPVRITEDVNSKKLSCTVDFVNAALKANARRRHSSERSDVAAAQALVLLRPDEKEQKTVRSVLYAIFRDPNWWKTSGHGDDWTRAIGTPLNDLASNALAELDVMEHASDGEPLFGFHQRAIAALAGIALAANPALIANRQHLTRSGRGRAEFQGARVSAVDPNSLLRKMLVDPAGIEQMRAAIAAVTSSENPYVPLDPETGAEITDLWLRDRWIRKEQKDIPDIEDPIVKFTLEVQRLAESLRTARDEADALKERHEEEDDDQSPLLYELVGIPPETADRGIDDVRVLQDFFQEGKFMARQRARDSR